MGAKAVRPPSLLLEALAVGIAGAFFALAANSLSPRGLNWSAPVKPTTPASPRNTPAPASARPGESIGVFATLSREEVLALQADSRSASGQFVFIDARSEHHYRAAHLPGARSLDPFNPGPHLEAVVAALGGAERVIIYCHGEQCTDSRLAAELIVGLGIPTDRIAIYHGGFKDWTESGQPLERGGHPLAKP